MLSIKKFTSRLRFPHCKALLKCLFLLKVSTLKMLCSTLFTDHLHNLWIASANLLVVSFLCYLKEHKLALDVINLSCWFVWRIQNGLKPVVNFINIIPTNFLYKSLFWQLFLVTFWLLLKICTKNLRIKRWWNSHLEELAPLMAGRGHSWPSTGHRVHWGHPLGPPHY